MPANTPPSPWQPDWQWPTGIAVQPVEDWMWHAPLPLPEEERVFTGASEKRRREFRAGRHCAHAALVSAGYRGTAVILRGDRGEPLWPAGFCGSITHSGHACFAAAASLKYASAIGIDVERHAPLKPGVIDKVATATEQQWLQSRAVAAPHTAWDVLLFSIKESIHKVYYPLNRHQLGFHDVTVQLDDNHPRFSVVIDKPCPTARHPLQTLEGGFATNGDYVLSWIVVPPCAA